MYSSRYKYFLTIVDDHSCFLWTYLLKSKSDVSTVLPNFFKQVLTQFNVSIKTIRCDNGSEFSLPALYNEYGTLVQYSCVETPQQNARVERKHQHLLNVARGLFFQSHIPIEYWGECILTASYLINRLPTLALLPSSITPFEILLKKPPTYTHLRVFGCLCYAPTLNRDMTKFSLRAQKCVLLGYPPGCKGYKLLNLTTNDILINKTVVFHESEFPFSSHPFIPFPFLIVIYLFHLLLHHIHFLLLILLFMFLLEQPQGDRSNHLLIYMTMYVDLLFPLLIQYIIFFILLICLLLIMLFAIILLQFLSLIPINKLPNTPSGRLQ